MFHLVVGNESVSLLLLEFKDCSFSRYYFHRQGALIVYKGFSNNHLA